MFEETKDVFPPLNVTNDQLVFDFVIMNYLQHLSKMLLALERKCRPLIPNNSLNVQACHISECSELMYFTEKQYFNK